MSAIDVRNIISKFMSNKRVTAYQIAIPLDLKLQLIAQWETCLGEKAASQALEFYLPPEN